MNFVIIIRIHSSYIMKNNNRFNLKYNFIFKKQSEIIFMIYYIR